GDSAWELGPHDLANAASLLVRRPVDGGHGRALLGLRRAALVGWARVVGAARGSVWRIRPQQGRAIPRVAGDQRAPVHEMARRDVGNVVRRGSWGWVGLPTPPSAPPRQAGAQQS